MMTFLQTDYQQITPMESAEIVAMSGLMLILAFAAYLFYSFCLYKIFKKAGVENAWGAFVPFYNNILLADVVRKPIWFGLLLCIPYLNIVFAIWGLNRLSKVFGQDIGFTLGLLFLSFIFFPILAFGDYRYQPNLVSDDRN